MFQTNEVIFNKECLLATVRASSTFAAARARLDAYLVERGMRRTHGREEILAEALRSRGHFTPDEIVRRLKARGADVSPVSVYRNLPVLCEAGILRRTCLVEGEIKYEAEWGQAHHDHLICSQCHTVIEFEYEAIEVLQQAVAASHGFVLTHHHLELVGVCSDCQKSLPVAVGQ